METKFQRQTAIKTNIKNIIFGKFVKTPEQEANYHLGANLQKLYRINLIAIIVQKEETGSVTNLMLDDGSGKISLRSFEKNKNVDNSNIGDIVLIIGKARSYNDEIYLSPEIVKKTDPTWLKLRSLKLRNELNLDHLKKSNDNVLEGNESSTDKDKQINNKIESKNEYLNEIKELAEIDIGINENINIDENLAKVQKNKDKNTGFINAGKLINEKNENQTYEQSKKNIDEKIEISKNKIEESEEKSQTEKNEGLFEDSLLPIQKIIKIIEKLDDGNGVMIEEIIEKSTLDNPEQIIEKMLETGDIFQIQPGKVKVL